MKKNTSRSPLTINGVEKCSLRAFSTSNIRVGVVKKYVACVVLAVTTSLPLTVSAAPVAWWRFEEADTRPTEVALSSTYNTPTLDATLDANQSAVALSTWIPGAYISDGVGGPTYANVQSLQGLVGGQAAFRNQLNNGSAAGLLNDTFVNNASAWTFETFVYLPAGISGDYGMIFGNGTPGGNGFTLDMGANDHTPRFFSGGVASGFVTGPSLSDNTWYHLALTATPDGNGTWTVSMYIDYQLVSSVANYQLDASTGYYGIAAPNNAFNGYVDEMRISNMALTTDQMLHAVPEPSLVALLAAAGLFAVFIQCRRNRQGLNVLRN